MLALTLFPITLLLILSFDVTLASGKVCENHGCQKISEFLLEMINFDADPCDDFYDFACGRGIRQAQKNRSSILFKDDISNLSPYFKISKMFKNYVNGVPIKRMSQRRLKAFLTSCLKNNIVSKEEMTKNWRNLFRELGGSPILGEQYGWTEEDSWENAMIKLHRKGANFHSLFRLMITPDIEDPSKFVVKIDRPLVPDRGITEHLEMIDILKKESGSVSVISRLLKIANFRAKLSSIKGNENENVELHKITLGDLKLIAPNTDWSMLIGYLIGKPIEDSEYIVMNDLDYIIELDKLFSTSDDGIIIDYMMVETIFHLNGFTKILGNEFSKCFLMMKTFAAFDLNVEYVREYIGAQAKKEVSDMIHLIKLEVGQMINQSDWISVPIRKIAIEKLNAIKEYPGYPEEFLNETLIEDIQGNIGLMNSDNFIENILRYRLSHLSAMSYAYQRNPRDLMWTIHAEVFEANAFYAPHHNSIHILSPMMGYLFFDESIPDYVNYATLGSVLGHEITHAFDPHGAQYDLNGFKNSWFDETTKEGFMKKAECFVQQYDGKPIPNTELKLDGRKTLGENMADNGGDEVAYRAYKRLQSGGEADDRLLPSINLNQDQLFWVGLASNWCRYYDPKLSKYIAEIDVHSPPKYRVNIPFSNLVQFSEAFNCPLGSKMNPKDKCKFA